MFTGTDCTVVEVVVAVDAVVIAVGVAVTVGVAIAVAVTACYRCLFMVQPADR